MTTVAGHEYSADPWVDIGGGVSIEIRRVDGAVGGVAYRHKKPSTGGPCEGYAPVAGPGALWTLVSSEPLTLAPSLLCLECKHHGFIQNGRWVPA